jgi:hypothetical protein
VGDLRDAAESVCGMNWTELVAFNDGRKKHNETLQNYCFLTTYAYSMLTTGYGFHLEDHITTATVIGGHKVGWPLGSTLYEINTLKWSYKDSATRTMGVGFMLVVVGFLVCVVVLATKLVSARKGRGSSFWSLVPEGSEYGSVGERGKLVPQNFREATINA